MQIKGKQNKRKNKTKRSEHFKAINLKKKKSKLVNFTDTRKYRASDKKFAQQNENVERKNQNKLNNSINNTFVLKSIQRQRDGERKNETESM